MGPANSEDGRKSLLATSLAHFINDGLIAMIPLIYPLLALYGVSLTTISVLVALQNVVAIFASPLVGVKSDASGNYSWLITLGLVMLAAGTIGYTISALFTSGFSLVLVLLPLTVLIGIGSAFYHPLGATVLRAKWRTETLGRAMGINGSAGSVGRVVLPLATTVLLGFLALPYLGIIPVLCLVSAFAVRMILKGVKFREVNALQPGIRPRASLLPRGELVTRLLPLTAVSFSRGFFTGVVPLIPLYLEQVDNFDKFTAGLLFSLSLGVGIISQLLFGYLQGRLGARKALTISNLGGVIVLFLFSLVTTQSIVILSVVLFGLFSYSAFPLLLGAVQDLTKLEEMTSGSAIVWGIGNSSGSAAAPLLVGALALYYSGSLVAGFLASAAIGTLSVLLMPFVRQTKTPPAAMELHLRTGGDGYS